MKKHKKFNYHAPSKKERDRRASQTGSNFDVMFKGDVQMFKPREGKNRIRILPATFNDAKHYGFDIFVHYGIGASEDRYLCLKKHGKGECPICAEQAKAKREGEDEVAKSLFANHRVLVWVIDREAKKQEPLLWAMPWRCDRDIAAVSQDEDSGEDLSVDHPEKGHDVIFYIKGKGKRMEYNSFKVAFKPSPISDDEDDQQEVLDYITEHPLDKVLKFYEEEYIEEVLRGGKKKKKRKDEDEEDEEEDRPRTRKKYDDGDEDDEDEDRPRKKKRKDEDDEDEIEDEDEDLDEDEDEEEERPRKKKRRKDEDDDEEEDEDDEDEEDDEEDDEDDEDDYEDEEDRPRSKTRKRIRAAFKKHRK